MIVFMSERNGGPDRIVLHILILYRALIEKFFSWEYFTLKLYKKSEKDSSTDMKIFGWEVIPEMVSF